MSIEGAVDTSIAGSHARIAGNCILIVVQGKVGNRPLLLIKNLKCCWDLKRIIDLYVEFYTIKAFSRASDIPSTHSNARPTDSGNHRDNHFSAGVNSSTATTVEAI